MRTMRADIKKQLAEMKEKIYELQRDLSMYLDDEQDELNTIAEDNEEYERQEEIVTALKDAVDNLEDAMDNIQIAID
jgi:methyl-accepting chemotaxis protein